MGFKREFEKKFGTGFIIVLALFSLLTVYYSIKVKNSYLTGYRANIIKAYDDMDEHQQEQADRILTVLDQGRLYIQEEEEHAHDFYDQAYFGEPWRKWVSSPLIWMKARNSMFVLVLMVFLFIPVGAMMEGISLSIARKKMEKAQAEPGETPSQKRKKYKDTHQIPGNRLFDRFSFSFRMDPRVGIVAIIILFGFSVSLAGNLTRDRLEYFPTSLDRPIGVQLFSEMIGEARTILASYIYIRADLYHHEREDKIRWDRDPATLPLYRVITALDPKNVNAYDFGGWHLAKNFGKYDQGISFLMEGLKYNPDSFQLHFTIGDIYYFKEEFQGAIRYYLKALDLAQDPTDIKNTLRRLYWSNRQLKNYALAGQYVRMMHSIDPTDASAKNLAEELHQLITGKKTEEEMEREKEELRRQHKEIHGDGPPDLDRDPHHHHHHH